MQRKGSMEEGWGNKGDWWEGIMTGDTLCVHMEVVNKKLKNKIKCPEGSCTYIKHPTRQMADLSFNDFEELE